MDRARFHQRLRTTAWLLFIGYSTFMIYLLFFGFSRSNRSVRMYNIIPFKTIANYIQEYHHYNFGIWVINLFGNVGAFIPFGILIPWLFPRHMKPLHLASLFVLVLTAVESLQFIGKVGSFDVDDILLNLIGVMIGRGCFSLMVWLGLVKGARK
ncbi:MULTISPECIES: VanZ family protein [unclassified Paenibacillus]|uniref:VanZ family protein n=1 Tax=unclassified Paenibacillus TaxID=185978 RepID=UPI00363D1748